MTTALPPDPYAPPAADLDAAVVHADPTAELATRGARFIGAMVDGFLFVVSTAPIYLGFGFEKTVEAQGTGSSNPFLIYAATGRWGIVAAVLLIVQLAVQWTLLYRRGQTVGKIFAGTRVVRTDGSRASFGRLIVLRTWVPFVTAYLQTPGMVVAVAELLFVFRKDRRCGHDLIADTKVIRVVRAK